MCRILAICTDTPELDRGFVEGALLDFRQLAATGCVARGLPAGHRDGWGIVAYKGGAPVFYARAVAAADEDSSFLEAAKLIASLAPDTVVAHLRKSSQGSLVVGNAQPFLADGLAFCHNGSLVVTVTPDESGSSDSLVTFRRAIAGGGRLEDLEREIGKGQIGSYTAAITVAVDGETVVARRQFNEAHPDAAARNFSGYFTLFAFERPGVRAVCSEVIPALAGLESHLLANGEKITLRESR